MTAPYQTDLVGSFLRPAKLQQARRDFRDKKITASQLAAIEDEAIEQLIQKLVAHGYPVVTDGEFRRGWYHSDFLGALEGIKLSTYTMNLFGEETLVGSTAITGPVAWNPRHPFIDHFRFAKKTADKYGVATKLDIPGPNMVLIDTITTDQENYYGHDFRRLAADFVKVYQAAIQSFYEAGCRYLQLDDPVWVCLVDDNFLNKIRQAGFDPEEVRQVFFDTAQEILAAKPADMDITLHICQGNLRSKKFYDAKYDGLVDTIFQLPFSGFFMEFDDEKYCNFELLEKLQGQKIVLGLVNTQSDELEDKARLLARIERAKQHVDPKQICIATQCGFASTAAGNLISEAGQWRKLDLVHELAESLR
ncbi:5-methyltetrahydropteroyltriglutamate--homocysteine S-methyltransferase [Lactobacillus nasalidis]|uniref:5-methyltetrahydropteroyltriglutamate--homocysteine S-methyltransferase n=1 Tax=Lactobacillus nasalidis TaxID=2797258 RepID=A0ABQ3W459_9LACO|nr:5-methyltetrahydropteroyltriglutamate--homocysteine S-methyltransferase [Lactobacillus nasalidis]GHV97566.1 5-methyltetrahydropteroyltriglutamate--homocysteine S-methyltransferase [Lactobacillus nasalidis]GHV99882.1 5-methyltetrahydropteroyltriglutamate--homocysteine S-methyltransferase [Lactobacillus nasalidis]GHW01280.1 5-methyltetrahydropteroyltriglutamate--homocysteine S-methyltransferase [Lactobacillus nasalidis]